MGGPTNCRVTQYETCASCARACRQSPCWVCSRRAAMRTCETCGCEFRRTGRGGNWRYCQACSEPTPKRGPAIPPDAAGCASCAHGRPSADSSVGWECSIAAAMRCRPYGAASLYVRREVEA